MKTKLIAISKTGIETYLMQDGDISAEIITYGARISKLNVKSASGDMVDVVAGFDDPEEYREDHGTYFGAIVGRVANRIKDGKFTLNGETYTLNKNQGEDHLHGGLEGFDKKIWAAKINDDGSLEMSYLSKDGEEGYGGNLSVKVTYVLKNNAISINYEAKSDKDTVCALTNHSYFNLSAEAEKILDHELYINSAAITDVNDNSVPTGDILNIKGTPFDFSTPKPIGRDIDKSLRLFKIANGGYDFNYILSSKKGEPAAYAYSKDSGIKMSVFTDALCVQLYIANYFDGFVGKRNYPYQSAFCLETQAYPNAVNIPSFPSVELKANDRYKTYTKYKFEII